MMLEDMCGSEENKWSRSGVEETVALVKNAKARERDQLLTKQLAPQSRSDSGLTHKYYRYLRETVYISLSEKIK